MARTSYAIGLGSNRPHGRHGSPERVLAAALATLAAEGCRIVAVAPVIASLPLGPSARRYANGAAIIESVLEPPALLRLLKRVERAYGRRGGRRWGARPLDSLDILLWSGGAWRERRLAVPHPELARRRFVLEPLAAIAGDWRMPGTALHVRHLRARLARRG